MICVSFTWDKINLWSIEICFSYFLVYNMYIFSYIVYIMYMYIIYIYTCFNQRYVIQNPLILTITCILPQYFLCPCPWGWDCKSGTRVVGANELPSGCLGCWRGHRQTRLFSHGEALGQHRVGVGLQQTIASSPAFSYQDLIRGNCLFFGVGGKSGELKRKLGEIWIVGHVEYYEYYLPLQIIQNIPPRNRLIRGASRLHWISQALKM